jgi:hypothetical protein
MKSLSEVLANANSPAARTVTVDGEDVRVYVRQITAGEQQQLLIGQKVTGGAGGASVEIDLQLSEKAKHMMVRFAICDDAGKRVFAADAEVAKLPARLVDQLFAVAKEVNSPADPEKLGNS